MPYLSGYTLRKKLTIDYTKIDATLANFPVRVYLNADTDIGAVSNADGFDIRFTEDDGTTPLKFEINDFVIAGGEATGNFWVKVPSISSSADTDIYIYYRAIDTADGQDVANTWSNGYIAVYHMGESGIPQDSLNSYNPTGDTSLQIAGLIENAQDFSPNQSIEFGNDIYSDAVWGLGTWEAFVKTNNAASGDRQPCNFEDSVVMRMWTTKFQALAQDSVGFKVVTGTTTPSTSLWYHLSQSWGPSVNLILYVNGISEGTPAALGASTLEFDSDSQNNRIGSDFNGGRGWDGLLDEIRHSDVIRTVEWLAASNESGRNNLLTYGSEEEESAAVVGPAFLLNFM